MTMTADADAIQAVKGGDKNRYAELIARYQRMVYGIAWSRLGDADLCEDAVQETFVKAFRYLLALRNPEKFQGWLARIARNVSTSLLRRHRRELDKRQRWRILQPDAPEEESSADDEEPLTETLTKTLADLPARHRECLVLFYLEGKNVREAAAVLGISEAAVKTRLYRARKVLRGKLEERLEASLTTLGGRGDYSAGVMALLPPIPLAATGLGASAFMGTGIGAVGKSLFLMPPNPNWRFESVKCAW